VFFLPSFGCDFSSKFQESWGLDFKNLVLLSNSIIQLRRIEEMVVFDWLTMMILTNYLH
jgi:hypothetical protein